MRDMAKKEDQILKALEKYLKAIWCWPEDEQNFSTITYLKAALPFIAVSAPIQLGLLGHLYKSISEGNLSEQIVGLFFVMIFLMFCIGGVFYLYKGNKFLRIREEFVKHNYGKPKNFKILNEKIDKVTHIIYYYHILLTVSFLPYWCIWDEDCLTKKNSNGQIMQGYMKGLVCPAWFPFNLEIFLRKQIIFICNLLLWFRFMPSITTTAVLIYAPIQLMVDKMEHLSEMVKEINFMDINKELTRAKLRTCVKYYSEIVLLLKDVNDILGIMYAPAQSGMMAIAVGLLEYQIVLEKNPMALLRLMYYLVGEAAGCYSGQTLEDASERLRENVYNLAWYEMDSTFRKDFKLFHALVQKTLHFKIKPNVNMNMVHYYTLMKGAYSLMMYFTRF